jgi:hypothetical protein
MEARVIKWRSALADNMPHLLRSAQPDQIDGWLFGTPPAAVLLSEVGDGDWKFETSPAVDDDGRVVWPCGWRELVKADRVLAGRVWSCYRRWEHEARPYRGYPLY